MTKPKAKQVLPKVADTLTEKPVEITIDVKPKNRLHRWLINKKILPAKRHFEVRPQRVINIYRIAGRAAQIEPGKLLQSEDRVGAFMELVSKHAEDIIYIVACALQNDHREPTKKLLNIVRNEIELDDILKVMQVAVANYNINSFISSIALIVGIDALKKASPEEKAE